MGAVTLTSLRAQALERADMVNSDFIDISELDAILNAQGAELHDLVVSALEDQFTVQALFTIVSPAFTYALATLPSTAPFYRLRGLDRDEGGGRWGEVRRFDFNDRNRAGVGGNASYARTVRYRLIGGLLYLNPETSAAGDYRLWYVPGYANLVSSGDTLDYPQNWTEYVVAGAAAWLLAKEESDASMQLRAQKALRERILTMAPARDAAGPERMVRVRNRPTDGYGYDSDDDELR